MAPSVKKAKRSTNAVWYGSKDGPVLMKDMHIRHLINAFHLTKEIASGENVLKGVMSDEKFAMEVFPEYDMLRQEIAYRLRCMEEGSLQRAYWHSKFSRRLLKTYPVVVNMFNDSVADEEDPEGDEFDFHH